MQVEASLTGHPVRMVSRTGLAWLLVMVVLAAGSPVGAAAEPAREELLPPRWPPPITLISGVSAVLVDAGSGQILLEQSAIEARPMASLVKIMTLRLALAALGRGELDPDQEVVVTPEASWLHWPGSSLMFLREGDRVTIRDLLYGVAVASGNEACVALAQAVWRRPASPSLLLTP